MTVTGPVGYTSIFQAIPATLSVAVRKSLFAITDWWCGNGHLVVELLVFNINNGSRFHTLQTGC